MSKGILKRMGFLSEPVFMITLYVFSLFVYGYDRNNPGITAADFTFFSIYAIAALIISYVLLPRFFYKEKFTQFFISVIVLLGLVIINEEFVLEQIFYPNTKRADNFPGIFFCLVGILPVVSILSGAKFAWDAFFKQKELDEIQQVVKESELQFLKSQINPHFLFNNLNNLYSYALENSPKTPEIILELSGVLRYMLYECKEAFVSVSKEITQLENFVRLNEMQIEERGTVHFETKNIHKEYKIAPLILVVFIENAFKHSTATQSSGIKINVDFEITETGKLIFICENSYQKSLLKPSELEGIGLKNVKKRLVLTYPNRYDLKIEDSETEYKVILQIDLHKENLS